MQLRTAEITSSPLKWLVQWDWYVSKIKLFQLHDVAIDNIGQTKSVGRKLLEHFAAKYTWPSCILFYRHQIQVKPDFISQLTCQQRASKFSLTSPSYFCTICTCIHSGRNESNGIIHTVCKCSKFNLSIRYRLYLLGNAIKIQLLLLFDH